jgi:two-component system, cell cycle sensor histidine kinase and response regulator CckA
VAPRHVQQPPFFPDERNASEAVAVAVAAEADAPVPPSLERPAAVIDPDPLRRIAGQLPGVLFAYWRRSDGMACIPHATPGLLDLCGVAPDEVARDAAAFFASVDAVDRPQLLRALDASGRTLHECQCQFRVARTSGPERWLELRARPAREPDGSTLWSGLLFEVTEQKRVERDLDDLRAHLAAALASSDMGSFVWDLLRGEVYRDDEGRVPLGLESEGGGVSEGSALAAIHPADRVVYAAEWQLAARGGRERIELRYRVPQADGKVRWQLARGRVQHDEQGRPVRVIGVHQDITEQKEWEDERWGIEAVFESAFRLNPAGSVLVRLGDLAVVDVNDAYLSMCSRDRREVTGRSLLEIPALPEPTLRAELLNRFLTESYLTDAEYEYRRKDDSVGHVLMSMGRLELAGETYALMVLNEITARKRAEQALRAAEGNFRQLAESIREVFLLTDPGDGRLLYVSPAYEAIWGHTCQSLYQQPQQRFDAIPDEDRARVLNAVRTKQTLGTYDEEYRIVRPDGTVRWIRDRAFPVRDAAGTVIRVAGVAEDITDRRSLEEELRQSQKMKSIGRLAGGVAHDFNNLLTVISGCTEELLQAELPDESARDALLDVRQAVERATSLTRDLLAFSRQEMLEPKVLDLNIIVHNAERMLGRLLGEDVALATELDPALPLVRVDPGHWASILINLAVNARDAMPKGGSLTLRTRAVFFDDAQAQKRIVHPGPYALLEMSDTGTGLSPEVQARIFEPFFTTKSTGKGTGLGLAVVHGIVQQSGGHIEVESELGVGTTFRIFLPAVTEVEADHEEVVSSASLGGRETICLVEDEESVRRVAVRGLQSHGFTVISANNGEDALRVLAEHPGSVDLLVTDVVMPNMGGRRLAEEVAFRYPATKVLYTSGYTDDAVVRHGISHAEVAFLQKPYTPRALLARVREVLGPSVSGKARG